MTQQLFERQNVLASCVALTPAFIGKERLLALPAGTLLLRVGVVIDQAFDGTTPSGRLHIDGVTLLGRAFDAEASVINHPLRYFPDGVKIGVQSNGTDVTAGHGVFFIEYIVVGRANEVYG